jgi:photosystem II stability/assembly factor-like uncharacterized protein
MNEKGGLMHSTQSTRVLARVGLAALCLVFLGSALAAQKTAETSKKITGTDPEFRVQGYARQLDMTGTSPFKALKWQFLGPKNRSGRSVGIAAVQPRGKSYAIYVATASGSLWKTTNEGTTWTPVFDKAPATTIGSVAVAPSDPNTVWIGTGEANIFRSSQAGIGVYKSTDAGKAWTAMGLTATATIPRIVIHPTNPDIVYVAASGREWTDNPDRGVFKTTDGGKTWDKVLYINEKTGAIDLVMDPDNPDTLYAATWQRMRKKWNDPRNDATTAWSGIYKTADAGKTWNPIDKGLPEPRFRGRIGIDICRTKPNVLYAFVDDYGKAETEQRELEDSYGRPSSGRIKGATVYRSDDSGATWTLVCPVTSEMKRYMEGHSGTYGWVFGQVRVDPNDPDVVYTLGLGLNQSLDGGKTFKTIGDMHVDHHGLWIDPDNSNYLIDVNDGGFVISYDKGLTWKEFQDNLPVTQFFDVAYDMATPFHVYGSVQDWGSFRGVVDLSQGRDKIPSQNFEEAPGGEGCTHAVDPTNPNIVYSCSFYGHIMRTDYSSGGSWYRATKSIFPAVYENEPPLRGQWLAPIILSPQDPSTVYLGLQYLYRSTNRGDTWERISPDLTYATASQMGDIPYHTVFALSESPLMHGLIYAGTDDGRLWVTKDGGKAWQEIDAGLVPLKWISRVQASAFKMSRVYMTQNGKRDDDFTPYVWKSEDYGKTWTSIVGNIPLGPVNVIREDPVNQDILYVGTDGGVFVTKDGGQTWNVLGGNLPMTYVHDIIIHPRDNIIVAATHGRGLWAMDAEPINEKAKRRRFFFVD